MNRVLTFSLLANLALAAWIGFRLVRPNPAPAVTASQTSAIEPKSGPRRFTRVHASAATSVATKDVVDRFNWGNLESSDYKTYMANLRAAGCPEETVRDIILADVDRLFAPRLAALRPKQEEFEFWKTGQSPYGAAQSAEERQKAREIYLEKQALLKELLGDDYPKDIARQFGYAAEEDAVMAAIPKEKKDQLQKIRERLNEERREINLKAKGHFSTELQDDLKALNRQARDEYAKILSPHELFEYELRNSELASSLKYNELRFFDATEQEFRAIFKAKQEREALERPQDVPASQAWRDEQKRINDELRAALGEERMVEYGRAQDGDYQNLVDLADSRDLPREVVDKVYAMKGDAEKAAREVNHNRELTSEQRQQALAAIRAETERAVAETLGERALKGYRSRAYWLSWLRSIAPQNATAPGGK
jgi:hypothetical protein